MAVGEVLPVISQFATECQQLRLLQMINSLQHLALGVGTFEWQVEFVQQSAEQAAIQQAKGFALYAMRTVLDGKGTKLLDLAKANLRQLF